MKPENKWFLIAITLTCFFVIGSCSKKNKAPKSEQHQKIIDSFEPFPADTGHLVAEYWYSVWLQDKPAGFHHVIVTRHKTPGGPRFLYKSHSKMIMRIGQDQSELTFEGKELVNASGQLLRLEETETEKGADSIVVSAGKVDQEMITIRGPEVKKTQFEPEAIRSESYRFLFLEQKPSINDTKNYRTFKTDLAGYVDNRLVVKKLPTDESGFIEVEQTTAAMLGVVAKIKLDDQLVPRETVTSLGALRLRFKRESRPLDFNQNNDAPDLAQLTIIPSNVKFKEPARVKRVKYSIQGFPGQVDESWLTGPGQSAVSSSAKGSFVIETTRPGKPESISFPPKITNPKLERFLVSTSLSQVDDPEIQATAKKITGGLSDSWTAAKRLRNYVSSSINGTRSLSFASAAEVLRQKKGDCSEQSVLLATLARAVGIPARCVMGLVYADGSYNRHMWTEVWVGRWQPLDAAMQVDFIGPTWIRLGVHLLQLSSDTREGIGGLLAFAADLKITVVEFESDDSSTILR
ncbi:MAG: transglutaminase domain-containing protein [Deltaproteobacteria bacterium]|nr:transglutaminase domain-containing protein [Deltaproteobacteria bacterium]